MEIASKRTLLLRSAPALLGLFAVALLQFSAAAHQLEHTDDHSYSACLTCTAFSEIDNVSVASAEPFECIVTTDVGVTRRSETVESVVVPQYQSRAPPLS